MIEPSIFDPYFLITKEGVDFGVTSLQTDDTINVGTKEFLEKEDTELKKAKLKAKPRTIMETGSSGDFNGCHLEVKEDEIVITQKGQANKITVIETTEDDKKQRYVEQRTRGAYIASICQPEAAFDFSVAAQAKEPTDEDMAKLNERLQWQIDNKQRGLRFKEIDLATAKIFVFVDGSFANNKDMSSQIGYVIILGNETSTDGEFTVHGNVVHWSSTKCKRITRSVLASEIYGMVSGFDLGYVVDHTLSTIAKRLNIPRPKLIVCTDSYSLYQCLVQLGTTNEKRLMIDIMSLRQSYENREIDEIRWIKGDDNPADTMTKASPNRALENIVTNNKMTIRIEGWVDR